MIPSVVKQFGMDLADTGAYVIAMSEIAPELCDRELLYSILEIEVPDRFVDKSGFTKACLDRALFLLDHASLLVRYNTLA
jgi:hypothetical protein